MNSNKHDTIKDATVTCTIQPFYEIYGTTVGTNPINKKYLYLRGLFALYSSCVVLWSQISFTILFPSHYIQWYFYLTHWAMVACTIYLVLSFTVSLKIYLHCKHSLPQPNSNSGINIHVNPNSNQFAAVGATSTDTMTAQDEMKQFYLSLTLDSIPNGMLLYKVTKLWLQICLSVEVLVVILYWSVLYAPPVSILSLHTHGIVGIMVTINFFISLEDMDYKNGSKHTFLFSFIWSMFSVLYYLIGLRNVWNNKRYIYPTQDFGGNLSSAIIITIFCYILNVACFCCLAFIKKKVLEKWINKDLHRQLMYCDHDNDKLANNIDKKNKNVHETTNQLTNVTVLAGGTHRSENENENPHAKNYALSSSTTTSMNTYAQTVNKTNAHNIGGADLTSNRLNIDGLKANHQVQNDGNLHTRSPSQSENGSNDTQM